MRVTEPNKQNHDNGHHLDVHYGCRDFSFVNN